MDNATDLGEMKNATDLREVDNATELSKVDNATDLGEMDYATDLGEVELQGIICGQGNVEAAVEVLQQRVAVVVEEEGVVAEGGHGDANLS